MGIASTRRPRCRPGLREATYSVGGVANSWADFGADFAGYGYAVDPAGLLHFRGLIKLGTSGTVARVLPSRVATDEVFAYGPNNTADGRVTADGADIEATGNNAFMSLAHLYSGFVA